MSRILRGLWHPRLILGLSIGGLLIFGFAQPRIVTGQSMSPTIGEPSLILVDTMASDIAVAQRGDIVATWFGDETPARPFSVKRVIGLPGERIELTDGAVFINDVRLAEPYLSAGTATTFEGYHCPAKRVCHPRLIVNLPADGYFVMGDNRAESVDSRDRGVVHASGLIGVVRLALPESLLGGTGIASAGIFSLLVFRRRRRIDHAHHEQDPNGIWISFGEDS